MDLTTVLFYTFALFAIIGSLGVLLHPNPLFSSLFLAVNMVIMAGLFYLLGATFIAATQLIVYAGAVIILFVMILMLFDIQKDKAIFSSNLVSQLFKVGVGGFLCMTIAAAISLSTEMVPSNPEMASSLGDTKMLAKILFTDYLMEFEVVGILLLMVAVGAVSLSRIKGGTHAKH